MLIRFNSDGFVGFFLTLSCSLFFILHTLGWAFIAGHSSYWNLETGDTIQHLAGLNIYLSSSWQFPWLGFDGLNYPQGTRVTFVDGIPILAFILKIFLPRNIGYINPMGFWIALNFLLQGIAAWWIAKELQIKSWGFLAFIFLAFLIFPAFVDRLRHVALMSHWIILFALALYLRGHRMHCLTIKSWSVLLFLAFYIHIYLFAMALGIYIAAVLGIKQKITWRYILISFLPFAILGASLYLFLLPLTPNSLNPENNFDVFSMDLLSPFMGGKLFVLQAHESHPFRGPSYLGLGVILVFLWATFSQCSKNFESFKKHWAFFLVMFLYFLYSLSSKICFGGKLIVAVDYPDCLMPIITQLRASGRFFWPVAYMIIIFSTYVLYRQFQNKKVFNFIIGIMLFIQCVDISHYYYRLKEKLALEPNKILNASSLDLILKKDIKYIYLFPICPDISGYVYKVLLPVEKYVAMHQLKLNVGYVSRDHYCPDMMTEIAQSNRSKSAYIFYKETYPHIDQVYKILGGENAVSCSRFELGYVCQFKS